MKKNNPYLNTKFAKLDELTPDQIDQLLNPQNNIICSFDLIHMVGWKYHESQAKPKSRGSAQFSLKDIVEDLNDKEELDADGNPVKIKYGVLIDDGDEIIEK